MMTTEDMILYDMVVDMGIATAEEINLCFSIAGGPWEELLNNIIFVRTGYRDMEQLYEAEGEE